MLNIGISMARSIQNSKWRERFANAKSEEEIRKPKPDLNEEDKDDPQPLDFEEIDKNILDDKIDVECIGDNIDHDLN